MKVRIKQAFQMNMGPFAGDNQLGVIDKPDTQEVKDFVKHHGYLVEAVLESKKPPKKDKSE